MFYFVAKDEPKIVYPVEPKRHSDYRRFGVQPETYAIDLARRQALNEHISDATFHHHARDVPDFFWINGKLAKLIERLGGSVKAATNQPADKPAAKPADPAGKTPHSELPGRATRSLMPAMTDRTRLCRAGAAVPGEAVTARNHAGIITFAAAPGSCQFPYLVPGHAQAAARTLPPG